MAVSLLFVWLFFGVASCAKFEDKWQKFCGVPDCYTELAVLPNATKAQIRRAYRNLSFEYHPDKTRGDQAGIDKFRRVARAYEVLTNDDERKKLDYYMENPGEYWQLYGSYISYSYAPKTSIFTVLLILLLFASAMQPAVQWSKYSMYVSRLKNAALSKAPLGAGGSHESLEIRRLAEEKLAAASADGKKKKVDRKKLEQAILDIIRGYDIQGEFRKPSLSEVPIVKLFWTLPVSYATSAYRSFVREYKRARNIELDEEEKQEIIEKFLGGPVAWDALTDNQQDDLIQKDCYIRENFDAWVKLQTTTTTAPPSSESKLKIRQRRKTPASKRD